MAHHKLDNYLRTVRKRAGLSQSEVAFLLGCEDGAKVSRYEHGARRPGLETVLAYELIFGTRAVELFAGLAEKVEHFVGKRARRLMKQLESRRPTRVRQQKIETIRRIAEGSNEELTQAA